MIRSAQRIAGKLRQHGHKALFAGGWVRDSLLHRASKDIDIVTSALPEEVLNLFPNSRSIGIQFGVIQVRMYGKAYEVATFRRDADYRDGRHPSSVFFSDPKHDAFRRDFTINGLFLDPETGRIIDYVRGRSDLEKGWIRAIGDPRKRFMEDKLRMLRAIRFACNLDFKIATGTWKAVEELSPLITEVSWERIRDELIGIFAGRAPDRGLILLQDSGLLPHILPETARLRGKYPPCKTSEDLLSHTIKTLKWMRKPSIPLAFAALFHEVEPFASPREPAKSSHPERPKSSRGIIEKACGRLRMSKKETERISDLVRSQILFLRVRQMRESVLKRFLRAPHFSEHLQLHHAHTASLGLPEDTFDYCRMKLKEFECEAVSEPFLRGNDLTRLGYRPGPIYSRILGSVEDLQLEGKLKSREEALQFVVETYPLEAGG